MQLTTRIKQNPSIFFAIINIIIFLILPWLTVTTGSSGYSTSMSFTAFDLTTDSLLPWVLLIIPALYLLIIFTDVLKEQQKVLLLILPSLGLVLSILIGYYIISAAASTTNITNNGMDMLFGDLGVSVSGDVAIGLGFILTVVSYIVMFVLTIKASRDIDYENETLNTFVQKSAVITDTITDRAATVINTAPVRPTPASPTARDTTRYTTCECGAKVEYGRKFCPECGKRAGKTCPSCHTSVNPDTKFCPECGKSLIPKIPRCSQCKTRLSDDAKFCPECGHPAK